MSYPVRFHGQDLRLIGQQGLDRQHVHLQPQIEQEAEAEGLGPLTAKQWAVVQYVLDFYTIYQSVPAAVKIGRAADLSPRRLQALFPAGAARTVFRMAGIDFPDDETLTTGSDVSWN